MKSLPWDSTAIQRALTRAGTVVWLVAGVALIVATVRMQLSGPPTAQASTHETSGITPISAETDSTLPRYQPGGEIESGHEIVLVFIGASFCNAHNVPGFGRVVEDAKLRVQQQALASGHRFRAVGVALDWSPADGLEFLSRFGEFDEVSAGSNWIGDGATRYIWRELPGSPDVPQILLLERRIDAGTGAIQLSGDRVAHRILGTTAIEEWVSSGAKL